MIANVVDYREMSLFARYAEATPELLQPKDRRLGGSEHQHRVDRRQINALVEYVDGKNDLQLTSSQLL